MKNKGTLISMLLLVGLLLLGLWFFIYAQQPSEEITEVVPENSIGPTSLPYSDGPSAPPPGV